MQKTLKSADYGRLIGLLVAARHAARLSQQQVANALGEHQSFVAKYEGGERRLDMLEFLAIARTLKADPLKLMAGFLEQAGSASLSAKSRKSGSARKR